ncbi:MAG: YitT family protein [Peptococcaceae bacterium]|nr:YitT family protein [Peptococcaceae bacterium]
MRFKKFLVKLIKKIPWYILKQSLGIIFGAIIVAISINTFILANRIADGGVTGIAIILHYLFNWETGLVVFILNIPLFFLGYKTMGKRLLIFSILGVATLSVALKYTAGIPVITRDTFLASVFGGLVTGIGMGLIFRFHGSLGGTDILAIFFNRKTSWSVGQIILGLDTIVFIGAAILFSPETAMYAMIYMFVASKIIDLVQGGLDYSKSLMVVTEKPQEIASDIIHKLNRGVTFLEAEGAYSGSKKKVIYCIVNRAQLTSAKEIIQGHDPQAFLAIGEVTEVLGEGFGNWKGH